MANKGNNGGFKRWAVLSAIALEMGVVIYVFVRIGKWLDVKFNGGENRYLIFLTLVGVAISLFLVVKQTNRLNSK